MGNLTSKRTIYSTVPALALLRPLFEALDLSPHDVSRLYETFCLFDIDRSGFVTTHELFAALAKDSTNFRDRVFALFDEDNSGRIDFREFVLTLWNYCTLSHASLVLFAFDLYDTDGTGSLSMEEVDGMLVDLYGKQANSHVQANKIRNDLRQFDMGAHITVKVFQKFVRTHPVLLFPAFQMQLALQDLIIGRHFWEKCATRREKISNGREVKKMRFFQWGSSKNHSSTSVIHPEDNNPQGDHSESVSKQNSDAKTIATSDRSLSPEESSSAHDTNSVLHPNQEIKKIILQVTGTLHHRRYYNELQEKHGLTSDKSVPKTSKTLSVVAATPASSTPDTSNRKNPRKASSGEILSPRDTLRINLHDKGISRNVSNLPTPLTLSPRPRSQNDAQEPSLHSYHKLLPSLQNEFQQSYEESNPDNANNRDNSARKASIRSPKSHAHTLLHHHQHHHTASNSPRYNGGGQKYTTSSPSSATSSSNKPRPVSASVIISERSALTASPRPSAVSTPRKTVHENSYRPNTSNNAHNNHSSLSPRRNHIQ